MNLDDYTVEVISTPEDQAFTQQCLDAGFDLILVSMFREKLERLVKSEREACALAVEQAGIEGYGTLAAAAIVRSRRQQ